MELTYKEEGLLKRPLLPLYDSAVKGNPLVYRFGLLFVIGLWSVFIFYIARSAVKIGEIHGVIMVLNVILLVLEFMTGNYFIFLLWAFFRSFIPVERAPGYLGMQLTDDDGPHGLAANHARLPFVSVLIPTYREHFPVLRKTLLGALDLNYPKDRFDVNVVDDSPSGDDLRKFCESNGVNYMTRSDRKGFKAGAINYALQRIKGDLVLFLDADHIPEPRLVINCLNAWRENTIGVQARIDFVNMVDMITTIGAFLHLHFYSLLQRARRVNGKAVFAGGTALIDKSLMIKEGGIDELTIAEDTDTSLQWLMKGYRMEYIDHVGSWALVPWDPLSLVRQVWRWMTGVTRSFRARWFRILFSNLPFYSKVDLFYAWFIPTMGVLAWLSSFIFAYLALIDGTLIRYSEPIMIGPFTFPLIGLVVSLIGSLPFIAGVGALLFDEPFLLYVRKGKFFRYTSTVLFFFVSMAGQPLMLFAVLKGWLGIKVSFNRTPKRKKANEPEIPSLKRRYAFGTLGLFLIGIFFLYAGLNAGISSPFFVPLFFAFYTSILPFSIAMFWYWRLEAYLEKVKDISAEMVIEEVTSVQV